MLGLLMAGLAVAMRWGTIPGVVLCAAAAGVKSPALLGVLFLGWAWAGPGASVARRIIHTVGAGLIALDLGGRSRGASGNGWGWLRTTTAADKSFTAVTPVNAISKAASAVAHVGGRAFLRARRAHRRRAPSGSPRRSDRDLAARRFVRSTTCRATSASPCWSWRSWARSCGAGTPPGA